MRLKTARRAKPGARTPQPRRGKDRANKSPREAREGRKEAREDPAPEKGGNRARGPSPKKGKMKAGTQESGPVKWA